MMVEVFLGGDFSRPAGAGLIRGSLLPDYGIGHQKWQSLGSNELPEK
jgi:hypothetical protein